MNHAHFGTARVLSGRRALSALAGLALGVLVLPGAALAQGVSDVPVPPNSSDAASDPFPFDPRLALDRYFKSALPSLWWANQPELSLGVFSVMIHLPPDWKGNPTSALMQLCPPNYSELWRHLDRIELVPLYRNARWAGTTCRK